MAIGYIYKLTIDDLVYYGSTTQTIRKRLHCHKNNYKQHVDGKRGYMSSFALFEKGIPQIEQVEEVHFENKNELMNRERFYIENNRCVNKNVPGKTYEERLALNKAERHALKAKNIIIPGLHVCIICGDRMNHHKDKIRLDCHNLCLKIENRRAFKG